MSVSWSSPTSPLAWIKDIILAPRRGEMPDRFPSQHPSTVAAVSESSSELDVDVIGPVGAPAALPAPPDLPAAAVERLPRRKLGIR